MSIDTAERYLQELEAIKNYSKVKQEKEEFSQNVEQLNISLDNARNEISSLKSLKANLDGAEMTLEEARRDFTHTQDAEIEKRAAERFEKLKVDYESKMPQLVYQRLCNILKQPLWPMELAKAIDTEAEKKANAILRDQNNWPQWFKKLYREEVERRVSTGLNQEFNARVETAAIARAQQRLEELINSEWPAWYQANVEPKIVEFQSRINANALQLLRGPWKLTCDRCGMSFDAELTAGEIEQLLRTGQIKVACGNPVCEDSGWFSSRRHTFNVSLHDFIEISITG